MIKILKYVGIPLLIIIVIGGYWIFGRKKQPQYESITARRGQLVQEVNVTGRVKPGRHIGYIFEKSGKVAHVYVKVGDKVTAGQILANISSADLAAQVKQAEASKEFQLAKLKELESGAKEEDLLLTETKILNAQKTFSASQENLVNAQLKADNDLKNLYDDIKQLVFDAYIKANNALYKVGQTNYGALAALKQDGEFLPLDYSGLDIVLLKTQNNLTAIRNVLSQFNDTFAAQMEINAVLASVTNQMQLIQTQKIINQNSLAAAELKIDESSNGISLAQAELDLKNAQATEAQIAAQQAQVKQAEAILENAQAQMEKTVIKSSIEGIVSSVDIEVGETASMNMPAVFVIENAELKLETFVPEADIAKISLGNKAIVTLDAYGDDVVFDAEVTAIDPAETMIEGVATYKVTLKFPTQDSRLKSGMTANVDIQTAQLENVVAVPLRAVITKDGNHFVRVLTGEEGKEEIKEIAVKTGLKSSDGSVEIIEGIAENDKVVLSITED